MRGLLAVPFLILSLNFSGCSTLDPDQKDIDAMAAEAYTKIKSEAKISQNAEWTAMLNRVASRVTKESGADLKWEWILIESPEVNAWAMPGGKIAVYTGIIPILKNEAGLAAVLGHEVSHVTLNHGKERYVRAIKGNMAGLVIGATTALGGQLLCESDTCRMLTGLGGAAAGFAITFFDMKFSREDESEADKSGQRYMAMAGYGPTEAIKVWERMSEAGGIAPPEFLSTHPSNTTRQKNLKQWLPEANELYSKAPQKFGEGKVITQ